MADPRAQQRLPQRRVIYTTTDRFDFDKSKIPGNMEYGWKAIAVGGQENTEHMIMCEMNGWTPVPANRHPELAGSRATEDQTIVRGGQMLMQIPKEYAKESRDIEKFEARNSLEEQIQRLGLQARQNGARGIKRSMDVVNSELVE